MHFHCCVVFLFYKQNTKYNPDDRHLVYFQFLTLQTFSLNVLVLIFNALFARGSLGQPSKCFDHTYSKNAFYNVTQKKKVFTTQF